MPNEQREFTNRVKDEDALYKHLAYQTIRNEKRKAIMNDKDATPDDKFQIMFNGNTFEHFYAEQLMKDATQPPRPVEMENVKPAKVLRAKDTPAPKLMTREDSEAQYWEDHSLYLERKKDQIDRTEMYYVLEQFYERARSKPDKESEAQRHMQEYFGNPENTYFYDKNKIV